MGQNSCGYLSWGQLSSEAKVREVIVLGVAVHWGNVRKPLRYTDSNIREHTPSLRLGIFKYAAQSSYRFPNHQMFHSIRNGRNFISFNTNLINNEIDHNP